MAINLKITYRISDLYTYLTRYSSPEDVLNAKGYEVVMGETIHTDINTIISEDRSQLSHRIEEQLKEYAREAELGLEVMSVTLASIHPPVAIADIYQSVVSAGIQKKTSVLTAEGKALVAREGAEADKQLAINDAGIQRDERVSSANAEIQKYNASIEAYLLAGALYANFGLGGSGSRWFSGLDGGGAGGEQAAETQTAGTQAETGAVPGEEGT